MVSIEDLSEKDLDKLRDFYSILKELAKKDNDIHSSHPIDAARKNYQQKVNTKKKKTQVNCNEYFSRKNNRSKRTEKGICH